MKKILALLLAASIVSFIGCAKKQETKVEEQKPRVENTEKAPNNANEPKGIAYFDIKFEKVEDSNAPKEISDQIEASKSKKGFIYHVDENSGEIYIAVFMGEKNTGGYGIEVVHVGDSEGKTGVTVKEIEPKQGDMVTEAITYPYTIIKAKGITTNINVENEKGEKYNKL